LGVGLAGFLEAHHSAVAAAAAVTCVGSALFGGGALWLDRRARRKRPAADKLREAIEAMPEGLAFYDAADRIVVWNRRYEELNAESGGMLAAGVGFRSLLEAGLKRGVYPEAQGRETEWLEERLAQRRAGDLVIEQENAGHWLRIVERRTADGGVVSVCEDITQLKAREASFRLMFEANPVPMWVTEAGTRRFLAVNEAALAHHGYSRAAFMAMNLYDVVAEDQHGELRAALAQRDANIPRVKRTWRHRLANGSEIEVEPFVERLDYEGRPALITAVFDVTLRKRAEEAMAQARDVAEAANRAKGEFLANMSHEIRTPLNGVTGVAQVLAQTALSPQQAEMVRMIESSAVTLERLLSDILDLARVESGRLEIHPEPFDLGEAVRATAALSELRAREKGIGFEVAVDPAAAGAVVGDAGRIKQILFNLLSNAVKFTPAGGVSLRVSVDDEVRPPRFTFRVADTGVGFQPECRERLFSRFEQEDGSITRQFGGSGLGLAISRDLAELMGGVLGAQSEPGEGATFTLTLDLPWADATGETEWEAAPAFMSGQEPRPLRVLLAEDHPINQKVVELMLAPMGADLSCVGNGQEAVDALAAERFDVVLMDMQMPVMDGLTAIRLIRERERRTGEPPTPIFTLSANAMSEHVEASLAAGADRHLTKPIAAPVLFGALGEIAERVAMAEAA
jgi:PAS domain S-box-containing protein